MATTAQTMPSSPGSNKRKRGQSEQDVGRTVKDSPSANGDSLQNDQIYTSLLQGITDSNMHSATLQQDESTRTAQAALSQPSTYPEPSVFDPSQLPPGFDDQQPPGGQSTPLTAMAGTGSQTIFDARQHNKPVVGSNAWHQMRKDNHKEVERRRREVINEGIENIAKMIPGNEKNKGAILQRTCRYIDELKAQIAAFDDERNVFEITQNELTTRIISLRDSAQRAWQETSKWQQRCRDADLDFDDYDAGPGDELDDGASVNPATISS